MTLERAVAALNEHRYRTWNTWEIQSAADGLWAVVPSPESPGGAVALLSAFEAVAIAEALSGSWVPVAERLPEPGEQVIAVRGEAGARRTLIFAYVNRDGAWQTWADEMLLDDVTLWLPMPAPPGEQGG